MTENKRYNYFRNKFNNLENGLQATLTNSVTFFNNYENISPDDSGIKYKQIEEKLIELETTEYNLRKEMEDQQLKAFDELITELDVDGETQETKDERYKQMLKDRINMYNHTTSYGLVLFASIFGMVYLSLPIVKKN